MQTSNANQHFMSEDLVWVHLAELSLSGFLPDQDQKETAIVSILFQIARDLGMSSQCMENIVRTLESFAGEASLHTKQGRLELPGRLRIFCQKMRIENTNSAKPSNLPNTEPSKEQKKVFPDPGIGGWGYFIITRVEVLPPHSSAVPHSCIDLYLYREGK